MDIWNPIIALGGLATAVFTAWTAVLARSAGESANEAAGRSNSAAEQATQAATKLAEIESQRRHSELCPRLRITCQPLNSGSDILRMQVALVGPPGLDRIDMLTVTIRNDNFLRGEDPVLEHMGGPTQEDVKRHIWGPYRFTPRVGPTNDAPADSTGRTVLYRSGLPFGEDLSFQLEHTFPGSWMRMGQDDWLRQQGTVIRLALTAEHTEHGKWYLPCEIDTANLPARVFLPQSQESETPT